MIQNRTLLIAQNAKKVLTIPDGEYSGIMAYTFVWVLDSKDIIIGRIDLKTNILNKWVNRTVKVIVKDFKARVYIIV